MRLPIPLEWRHNGRDGVSNHQHLDCLLNRLFRHRSKKTSLAFVRGIHRSPVISPHKGPGTRKMFPFDDVIMHCSKLNRLVFRISMSYHIPHRPKFMITFQVPWWRRQVETLSALLTIWEGNSPVNGEFLAQRPVTWSVDVFFYLCLNKRSSKQWWGWWFETPSPPLRRHCNTLSQLISVNETGPSS